MSAIKLEACPFCGADALISEYGRHAICSAQPIPCTPWMLVENWNSRVQPAEEVQPAAWVLTRQLEERETTCNGRLWFSDPKNAAWTPIYTSSPAADLDKLDADRYRWLRDPMSGSSRHDPAVYKDGPQEDVEWAYGEELDTIVDEAMARDFAQRSKWEKKP